MTESPRPLPGNDKPGGVTAATAGAPAGQTAGAIMKAARERQGLHIAILAATIKVSPRKLEALEQDRYEELSNASFVRALAQSVCRSLKVDPRPVLALLPVPDPAALERSVGSLNAPFRERPGRNDSAMSSGTSRPVLWAGALLLLGAAAVYFVPPQFWASALRMPEREKSEVALPAPPSAVTSDPVISATPLPTPVDGPPSSSVLTSAPTPPPASAIAGEPRPPAAAVVTPAVEALPATVAAKSPPASAAAVGSGKLLLTANASSWVEVLDSAGKVLLSRTLEPGEAIDVDGAFPLRLKVGNAAGLQVALRGRAVDLSSYTRDNVARFELR